MVGPQNSWCSGEDRCDVGEVGSRGARSLGSKVDVCRAGSLRSFGDEGKVDWLSRAWRITRSHSPLYHGVIVMFLGAFQLVSCALWARRLEYFESFRCTLNSTTALSLWVAFDHLRTHEIRLERLASATFLLMWVVDVVNNYIYAFPAECEEMELVNEALQAIVWGAQTFAALGSIHCSVEMAENAFQSHVAGAGILRARFLAVLPTAYAAISSVLVLCYVAYGGWSIDPWVRWLCGDTYESLYLFVYNVINGLAWATCGVLSWLSFSAMYRAAALDASLAAGGFMHAEAKWARSVIGRARTTTAFLCCVVILYHAYWTSYHLSILCGEDDWWPTARLFCSDAWYVIAEFLAIVVLLGFFRPSQPALKDFEDRAVASQRHVAPERSDAWVATVRALAGRGISAGELLEFYNKLGSAEAMPNFDPQVHTTNDVARRAIIPLSRAGSGGVAYAQVLEPASGEASWPSCLVTHDWRNLFVNLVAAVLADALGQNEYREVLGMLIKQDILGLQAKLAYAGVDSQRYWICCFCVNQHASTCHCFGAAPPPGSSERARWHSNCFDSRSGDEHPLCPCCEAKFLHGALDECELNKFDDMLELLVRLDPDFRQVVAVDPQLETFGRLWCIAELVQAHNLNMRQSVCLIADSVMELDETCMRLANFDVASCSASRQEDQDAILAKIRDVDEFNAQVQNLLLGERGLLGGRLVGFDALHAAVRAARMVKTVSGRTPDHAIQSKCTASGTSVELSASGGSNRSVPINVDLEVAVRREDAAW